MVCTTHPYYSHVRRRHLVADVEHIIKNMMYACKETNWRVVSGMYPSVHMTSDSSLAQLTTFTPVQSHSRCGSRVTPGVEARSITIVVKVPGTVIYPKMLGLPRVLHNPAVTKNERYSNAGHGYNRSANLLPREILSFGSQYQQQKSHRV